MASDGVGASPDSIFGPVRPFSPLGILLAEWRLECPTVQLKSFGSVFLVWVGRLYVSYVCWVFRGLRPGFGVPGAQFGPSEACSEGLPTQNLTKSKVGFLVTPLF